MAVPPGQAPVINGKSKTVFTPTENNIDSIIRKHSSRMRTARLETVPATTRCRSWGSPKEQV